MRWLALYAAAAVTACGGAGAGAKVDSGLGSNAPSVPEAGAEPASVPEAGTSSEADVASPPPMGSSSGGGSLRPNCDGGAPAPMGSKDAWTQVALPNLATGDYCQSIVVDPVNPSSLYTACGNNDGRKMKWYATNDYGSTWSLVNNSAMNGDPWGFSIDPNPKRDRCTFPTIYSPAGYGSYGAWKSTDGAATWTRLAGADSAFMPYDPYGATDLYHVAVLPDDPPNHVLATYHYSFKGVAEGGFGETWDGGQTWVIHPPPSGIGTSHYVIPISGTTWCVIAQANSGANGIWCTTTAGRTGGTAANKYRDGTISTSAWKNVANVEHSHGSYTPLKIGTAWYSPGISPSETSIWKSTDEGATWQDLVPGYYWASPPNPKYQNKNSTAVAATANYIYSLAAAQPQLVRAPVSDDTTWTTGYTTDPAGLSGNGPNPMGAVATVDPTSQTWMVFTATNNGVWRYIEP
jgi:hypothetical protein